MNDVRITADQLETLHTWMQRALRRGLEVPKLRQSIDNPHQLDRLIAFIDAGCPVDFSFPYSFAHNAHIVCEVLGLTNACTEKMPLLEHRTSIVWYGGWSIEELAATGLVVNHLKELQDCRVPAGYYDVRIPVAATNGMTHDEQVIELRNQYAAYNELPAVVGVTILAVHFAVTCKDLLNGKFCFCAETLPDGRRPVLYMQNRRVLIYYGRDNRRSNDLFAAAALKA